MRTTHSVISIGTEKMKVEQAKMNLLQKAKARPDQVRKVIDTARNMGWKSAYEKVRNRLSSPTPLGYSAAGIVVAVAIFILCMAANIPALSAIPGTVFGFASTFGYLLQTPNMLTQEILFGAAFTNPLIIMSISLAVGAIFGSISAKLGAAMTKEEAA